MSYLILLYRFKISGMMLLVLSPLHVCGVPGRAVHLIEGQLCLGVGNGTTSLLFKQNLYRSCVEIFIVVNDQAESNLYLQYEQKGNDAGRYGNSDEHQSV
jgi:hypothetical protein